MPPKPASSTNLTDSSTYPHILPLWTRDKIRFDKPQAGTPEPHPQPAIDYGQYDPWFDRMEPAFRFATRAVISSSPFFLKVLFADVIDTGSSKKYLDPNFVPSDLQRRQYRDMLTDLSANHSLYVYDHGTMFKGGRDNSYAASTISSNRDGYVFWTILHEHFKNWYSRTDFDHVPWIERQRMNLLLGITLAHEYTHLVRYWRLWKEKFVGKRHEHLSKQYLDFMQGRDAAVEDPCFDTHQELQELGCAWEQSTMEGQIGLEGDTTVAGIKMMDVKAGLVWGIRDNRCGTIQSRTYLALEKELAARDNIGQTTFVEDYAVERFMSEGCWSYLEDLLRVDNVPSPAQAALIRSVSLTHILKSPLTYAWLLYIPRRDFSGTRLPYARMETELHGILVSERQARDVTAAAAAAAATQAPGTAAIGAQGPPVTTATGTIPSSIVLNGRRYILDLSYSAPVPTQANAGNRAGQTSTSQTAASDAGPQPASTSQDGTSSSSDGGASLRKSKSSNQGKQKKTVGPRGHRKKPKP